MSTTPKPAPTPDWRAGFDTKAQHFIACEVDHDLREGKAQRVRWTNYAMASALATMGKHETAAETAQAEIARLTAELVSMQHGLEMASKVILSKNAERLKDLEELGRLNGEYVTACNERDQERARADAADLRARLNGHAAETHLNHALRSDEELDKVTTQVAKLRGILIRIECWPGDCIDAPGRCGDANPKEIAAEALAQSPADCAKELDREELGKLVRKVWIEWAREQPNPKPSWLVEWEGLNEADKEVDRRIGEAIARRTLGIDA